MVKLLFAGVIAAFITVGCAPIPTCCGPDGYVSPVQSPSDDKAYRVISLDNQLEVLLISDEDSPKAAASLDVLVGSGENPADRGGLAHFLEHMLFMGTEKYPEVDGYDKYLTENGGTHNAYTSSEHTNYFFDIDAPALPEALDRFSQFFVAPLLNPEYVAREMNAVEAEYRMGIKSDGRRMLDVIRELASAEHPFSRFAVGNLESLADRPGQDIREDLLAFYKKYYSSQSMRLVIYGPQSLEELSALAEKYFSDIPNRGYPVEAVKAPLFEKKDLPLLVQIEPAATQRQMQLFFPVEDYRALYKSKPLTYLGGLIGDEGKGSLLSYLKEQGWAEGLSAGVGTDWRGGALFSVSINLSAEGYEHWREVNGAVVAYLEEIREAGPTRWRFEEEGKLSQLAFRFQDERAPMNLVMGLSNDMHYYAIEDVLEGPYQMTKYRPDLIREALSDMQMDNVMVILSAPGVETDKQSEYFFVNYQAQTVTEEDLVADVGDLASVLELPEPNPFVPTDFALVESDPEKTAKPVLIAEDPRMTVWQRHDDVFEVPRGLLQVRFSGAPVSDSPENVMLASMYAELISDRAGELSYPALTAGLHYGLSPAAEGFTFSLSGYNDKQVVLLKALQKQFSDFEFSPERFANIKAEVQRSIENRVTERPYRQARRHLDQLLLTGVWSNEQKLEAVKGVTLDQVVAFGKSFWANAQGEAFLYGNYDLEQAAQIVDVLRAMTADGDVQPTERQLVATLTPTQSSRFNAEIDHNDSVVLWYLQGPSNSISDRALTAFSAYTTDQQFFNDLRTERQMGYVAASFSFPRRDVPGWLMMVQSPNHSAAAVADAMNEFRLNHLNNIDDGQFERYRTALINELLEPSKNLYEEGAKNWRSLELEDYEFNDTQLIAQELEAMTFDVWQAYFNKHFIEQPAWIQVVAPGGFEDLPTQPAEIIKDPDSFKKNHVARPMR